LEELNDMKQLLQMVVTDATLGKDRLKGKITSKDIRKLVDTWLEEQAWDL